MLQVVTSAAWAIALWVATGVAAPGGGTSNSAVIHNFVKPGFVPDDGGLTPNSASPLVNGEPAFPVDVDGNGVEQHNGHITYSDGTYYLYAEPWACGRGASSDPLTYQHVGQCGITTYSSPDLMHWTLENLWQPFSGTVGVAQKPQAHWSPGLNNWVIWIKAGANLVDNGTFYYAESLSNTAAGPWGEALPVTGVHLAHDHDIATGPDGSSWILTDSYSGVNDSVNTGLPLWDLWVQKLNDDLTGTVNTPETMIRIWHAINFEAVSFFYRQGKWYVMGGPTCGNCPVAISCIYANSGATPLGIWTNEAGDTGEALVGGTLLSADGCSGQNKGANSLPTASGQDVIPLGIWGYRTSPSDVVAGGMVQFGDASQAISSTFWYPAKFDCQGHLKLSCTTDAVVPLAAGATASGSVPPALQPDCRVWNTTTIIQQGLALSCSDTLSFPVYQLTDNGVGPQLNGPLDIEITCSDKTTKKVSYEPGYVSWAPHLVELSLDAGHSCHSIASISLSTNGTNGCYGVLVQKRDAAGSYGTMEGGSITVDPDAQLFVKG